MIVVVVSGHAVAYEELAQGGSVCECEMKEDDHRGSKEPSCLEASEDWWYS